MCCRYILCKFLFITVSRFSLSLAATIACVSFAALQLTSLFLLTTPPESAAAAFRWFATPLCLVRVKVDTLTFQLLLSLRFVSLVRSQVIFLPQLPWFLLFLATAAWFGLLSCASCLRC